MSNAAVSPSTTEMAQECPQPGAIFDVDVDKIKEDNPRHDYGTPEEQRLFDASMAREQHYPVMLRVDTTLAGHFTMMDGHRRLRIARRLGWKKIRSMLVRPDVTQSDVRLIQCRIDLHHKKLAEGERYKLVKEIEAAHSTLSGKELAELIEMDPTVLSRYRGLNRLIPDAMDAFFAGKLGLKAAAEISQLKPDEQPALLQIRLGGGTVQEVAAARKRGGRTTPEDGVKLERLPVALNAGVVLIKAKKGQEPLNLAGARTLLVDALARVDAAIRDGFSIKTAARAWDETKNKPPKRRKRREPA